MVSNIGNYVHPVSMVQVHYETNILPKLCEEILSMNLGRRANSCLANAEICTMEQLVEAIKQERCIPMMDKGDIEDIKEYLTKKQLL